MKTLQPTSTQDAASTMTMAALIDLILADATLWETRRKNLASSIRVFCRALGLTPEEAPATFWYFRERLEHFHPMQAGIKPRRWATVKADVAAALKHIGLAPNQAKPRLPFGDAWTELRSRMPSENVQWNLSQFGRFCDDRGIEPAQVDDAIVADFVDMLRSCSFKTKPNRRHRDLCRQWNQLAHSAPDLGLRPLTLPDYRHNYTPAWDDLPVSFRADAEAWLTSMSEEADLLSAMGPIRPLRPATIDAYRFALRQIVAGLVHSGRPMATITDLATLVEPEAATAALQFYVDRTDNQPTKMTAMISHVLVLVAKTAVGVDQPTLEKLKLFRSRLTPQSAGLSARPRAALQQFVDRDNIEKLLMLPQITHERLKRKADLDLADARQMQVALALELLLMRPIRRKNLIALQLGKHVRRIGNKRLIVIEADDVKNRVSHEYTIPPETARLLDFYVDRLLPLFGDNPAGFLFPGEVPGRTKSGEQFGRFFTKTIREQTGLYVYPHLLRHFGATVYLTENPNGIEVVRRVLGHRNADTTSRSYAGTQDAAAMQAFDNVVLRIRADIMKEVGNA